MIPSRRPTGVLLALIVAASLVGLAASAVLDGGADGAKPASNDADRRVAFGRDAVCEAAALAGRAELEEARRVFLDRAELPLHELAAAASERERALAARLLEAKERVEGQLDEPGPQLAADLRTLGRAAGLALGVVGGADPGPCEGAGSGR